MAQQQIITKPYVGELQDNDSLFINHDGALRQIKKSDADFASGADMRAEVAAREAFETSVGEQIAEKANVDGYYEGMTVGDAEQLVATQFVEDNEPYLFRPTGGSSDVGNRAYFDKIVGGTVAWNQICVPMNRSNGGVTMVSNGDGSLTLNGTSPSNASAWFGFTSTPKSIIGHKYLVDKGTDSNDIYLTNDGKGINTGLTKRAVVGSSTELKWFYIAVQSSTTLDNLVIKPQIFDLTQMFGSTIADYIYSLEQSQAGAGVAWFKKLFPNDYYAYNAGELLSVEGLSAHVMRDADNSVIGNYPLDSSLTLRGIPKLDASNNLYYDGDEYTSDGKVKRKRKRLLIDGDAQKITGAWGANNAGYAVYKTIPDIKQEKSTRLTDLISDKFVVSGNGQLAMPLYSFGGESGAYTTVTFILPSTVTSVAEANAWFASNPTTIEYPLATPTTETAEPFQNIQVVDDFGTEEFVSTGIVPVGHKTRYPANLRDKLQHLPDLASMDGTYLIQQSDKQMSLVYMPAVFPETPTEDGTYTLKTVVTGGVATLQWVIE